jgi:hypothetical protein
MAMVAHASQMLQGDWIVCINEMAMTPTSGLVFVTMAGTLAFLGLAFLGRGGFAVFFSDPARTTLAIGVDHMRPLTTASSSTPRRRGRSASNAAHSSASGRRRFSGIGTIRRCHFGDLNAEPRFVDNLSPLPGLRQETQPDVAHPASYRSRMVRPKTGAGKAKSEHDAWLTWRLPTKQKGSSVDA